MVLMMKQLNDVMKANVNAYFFKGGGKAMSDYKYE